MNVATARDQLEAVMTGTEGNVEMNAGNLNVPDEPAGELATTIAWPQLTLAITGGTLDIEAEFSQTAEMMAGSEFSRAWATATAISLENKSCDSQNKKGPLATRTRNAMDKKNTNQPHNH